ncbi:exonuclease domain-containing protein [Streptomyces sp. MAR4 CNX-425]|uniref:3'-5' exonuclease n=1 Tax=Streptomyces sp. MAR4 CNX-425 TaxID=3406343 RepID=UPI003B500379
MTFSDWPSPLYVVDVEGNGANPPDLVEIAAVPLTDGRPRPDQIRQWLIRPPTPIPARISRIHGITNQMTADAPAWPEIADEVHRTLDGAWIAAHSASVEYRVLGSHLPGWQPAGVIDTLRLAKHTAPRRSAYSLDTLLVRTGIDLSDIPGTRHRADYDAHATARLLLHLAERYSSFAELQAAAVPPGMPGHPEQQPEETLW